MEEYEIQIGKMIDLATGKVIPSQTIIINRSQLELIEHFADTSKDESLNTIYKLNKCEFKVIPHLDFGKREDVIVYKGNDSNPQKHSASQSASETYCDCEVKDPYIKGMWVVCGNCERVIKDD